MPIIVLPDEVASQIAAGEVVERPSSVVKELLENALDATAKQIIIRVEKAGKKLIEVYDDGVGIPLKEMQLAVARHATSKLRTAQDLQHVQTLGFRGEALASIGSVSRFALISRTAQSEVGGKLEVNGGQMGSIQPIGVAVGTSVGVRDLFYNVPARLKFLKSDATERQRVDELVSRYALAYPAVRFQLFHDGKDVLKSTGSGDRREVLAELYGIELARQLIDVSFQEDDFQVSGYISPISVTRSNRKEISFFVNGRWVQDIALSSALVKAYQTYLMVGRYPLAFLFINLSPDRVDVNVHPTKAEIRFEDSGAVFARVQRAVKRALMSFSPVPQIPTRLWHPHPVDRMVDPAWDMAADTHVSNVEMSGLQPETAAPPAQVELPGTGMPLLRLIGQIGGTYLVAEGPDGLYLIDQHAAHERILYERFIKRLGEAIPSQVLLEPVVVQIPPEKARLLEEQTELLGSLGIQIEPFGPGSFRVRAIPAFLSGADPAAIVQVILGDFEEDETPFQHELEKRLIARICKRSAVKGGQVLSGEEQEKLLRDLEACQSPRTCPHGRPTMIHLSVDLLERQFGRRGSL